MRLFTAIDLPEKIEDDLERLIERLRPAAPIKWSPRDNLHVTLKFIGEWPEERLEELKSALRAIPVRDPIPISIEGLGWFPNPHNPRVFWVAVHAPDSLKALAREVDRALAPFGIEKEKREYSPHLTLARIKEPVPLQRLRQEIAALLTVEFGSFTADRFFLYQSRLQPSGSVYTKLAEFPFRP